MLTLGACNGPGDNGDGDEGTATDTVVVAYPVDMEGVNELTTQSTAFHNALLYHALFLPLLEEQADYQEGPPTFAPRLAESYEMSDDRSVVTFHLRPDVTWSDGVPITAEDVRFTWEAQMSPEVGWPFAEVKQYVRDVEVVDPHTVRFHFTRAYSAQLLDANLGVILPKHAWGKLPFSEWQDNNQWFTDNLVVSGPFDLESHVPQQRVILRRNPRYFEEGLPKVDRIVFELVRDPKAQLAMLRSGRAHFVEFVPPAEVPAVRDSEETYLITFIPRFFYYVVWNTQKPFFSDTKTRLALTYAIDRQAIIDSFFYGLASPSHSPFTTDVWVHNDSLEPIPHDPNRARELLAEAGWSDDDGDGILERDGEPFRFVLMTNSENDLRRNIVVMLQEQLKQIGIGVESRFMEFNAMFGPLQEHSFDAVVVGMAMDTSLNTDYFFHTRGIEDGYNWGGYSNPELDAIIDAIEAEVDPLAAKPHFDRMQEILHEEQPLTFLYQGVRTCGARKELQGLAPNALSSFFKIRQWELTDGG